MASDIAHLASLLSHMPGPGQQTEHRPAHYEFLFLLFNTTCTHMENDSRCSALPAMHAAQRTAWPAQSVQHCLAAVAMASAQWSPWSGVLTQTIESYTHTNLTASGIARATEHHLVTALHTPWDARPQNARPHNARPHNVKTGNSRVRCITA
jgi:hypothetical protein